jgi:hypothetical protein
MVLSPINKTSQYPIEAQYDTGATLNFITGDMAHEWGLKKERLESPQEITTAAGPGGKCEYRVLANWRGRPGCGGRVEFLVLPETSTITKPLIGTEGKECWDELLDEQPKDNIYYTALSKQKVSAACSSCCFVRQLIVIQAPERSETIALRAKALDQQSQLQAKKDAHDERRGISSSKSKGTRSNEKKTSRN